MTFRIGRREFITLSAARWWRGRSQRKAVLAARTVEGGLRRRARRTDAFAALGLDAWRDGGRRPNRIVLLNGNHAGSRLVDHVDLGGFDRLRPPLFWPRVSLRSCPRAEPWTSLSLVSVLCRHIAPKLGACLAAFRALLRVATRFFAFAMIISS